jgi:hypothetical protein
MSRKFDRTFRSRTSRTFHRIFDLSPKRQPKIQQNKATQPDVSDDKIAERSDNSAPKGQAKIFTNEEALAALLTDIGFGRTFASQSVLAKRFGPIELNSQRMVARMVRQRVDPKTKKARPVQGNRLDSGENGMTQMAKQPRRR